jgi:phosphoglycolate phosphatase
MLRGAIFDKDGTLFHFGASWDAWTANLIRELSSGSAEHARRIADRLDYDLSSGRFNCGSPVIAGTLAEISALLASVLPEWSPAELEGYLERSAAQAEMVPAVDLVPFFDRLGARGLALGVATNDAEGAARAHLHRAGILDRLDFLAGYDSGHGGKPGPGQLLAFAAACALEPREVVMVGDSVHDLQAGRAAGMVCVGVLTGPADAATLAPLADAVLDDIGALEGWLRDR